jgi:hypothetical protein
MLSKTLTVAAAALVTSAWATAGASAAWQDRPGAETPDGVLDTLVALDIEPDRLLRAVLGADGALRLDGDRGFGDALTVDLRVADGAEYAALYRRLTGAPLPDGVDLEELAKAVNWALWDPNAFLAAGGTMNDLRRARREAARNSLEDPASVTSDASAEVAELRPAGEAIPAAETLDLGSEASIPSPGALSLLLVAGGVGARRRR